jgi:hypothetical protein
MQGHTPNHRHIRRRPTVDSQLPGNYPSCANTECTNNARRIPELRARIASVNAASQKEYEEGVRQYEWRYRKINALADERERLWQWDRELVARRAAYEENMGCNGAGSTTGDKADACFWTIAILPSSAWISEILLGSFAGHRHSTLDGDIPFTSAYHPSQIARDSVPFR